MTNIRSEPAGGRPDPGLDAIMSERRQLINLTYRMLGSLTEAEDAVQETYARWYAMTPDQQRAIVSPGAWLTTVASRICLNLLGSARVRRETYAGLAVTFVDPIEGGEQIARAWIEIANQAPSGMAIMERTVKGPPGLVAQQDGVTVTVFAFEIADGRIKHIWAIRNPEKLRPWTSG